MVYLWYNPIALKRKEGKHMLERGNVYQGPKNREGAVFAAEWESLFQQAAQVMQEAGLEKVNVGKYPYQEDFLGRPLKKHQVRLRVLRADGREKLSNFWAIALPAIKFVVGLQKQGLPEEEQAGLTSDFLKQKAQEVKEKAA